MAKAELVIPEEAVDQQTSVVLTRAEALLEQVEQMGDITTPTQDMEQKTLQAAVKKALSDWDEERQSLTLPLYRVQKDINNRFKIAAEPANQALSILNGRIKRYYADQQEAARKEQARLNAQAAKKQRAAEKKAEETGTPVPEPIIPMAFIPEPAKTTETAAGKVTVRKIWSWKVAKTEADSIRALVEAGRFDLLQINEKVIGASVRAGVREIPGLIVYEELSV